jgi:hypothetical protein
MHSCAYMRPGATPSIRQIRALSAVESCAQPDITGFGVTAGGHPRDLVAVHTGRADLARVRSGNTTESEPGRVAVTREHRAGAPGIPPRRVRHVYSGSHELPDPGISHQFSSSSPDSGISHRFPGSSPPSDTQIGEISPKRAPLEHAAVVSPSWGEVTGRSGQVPPRHSNWWGNPPHAHRLNTPASRSAVRIAVDHGALIAGGQP